MFSHQERVWSQLRQWDAGVTMLSSLGRRARTTFKKLPKARPSRKVKMAPRIWISLEGWMAVLQWLAVEGQTKAKATAGPSTPLRCAQDDGISCLDVEMLLCVNR